VAFVLFLVGAGGGGGGGRGGFRAPPPPPPPPQGASFYHLARPRELGRGAISLVMGGPLTR
jgi:hypothetical protein